MKVVGPQTPLTGTSYPNALNMFEEYVTLVLHDLGEHSNQVRDVIIRNFIARTFVTLKSIVYLWRTGANADCWALLRCMVDRFVYLVSLARTDSFEAFEKWSFRKQYEYNQRAMADPLFRDNLRPNAFAPDEKKRKRYAAIVGDNVKWTPPRAGEVLRNVDGEDWSFLYWYSYSFASSHVHPLANDGQLEYANLTSGAANVRPIEPEDYTALNNAFLVMTVVVQQGLNNSTLAWRKPVYDFLERFRTFLGTSQDCMGTLIRVRAAAAEGPLCRPKGVPANT